MSDRASNEGKATPRQRLKGKLNPPRPSQEFMDAHPGLFRAPTEEEKRQAILSAQLEPSVITVCQTCGGWNFMARLGCSNHDCPDQPWAVNVVYRLVNQQGQELRPRRDFMFLDWRPLTEWT